MKKILLIIFSISCFALLAQDVNEVLDDNSKESINISIDSKKEVNTKKMFGPGMKLENNEDSMSLGIPLFRLTMAFGVLFILMGLIIFAIKRWGSKFSGLENEATIKVIARTHIDTKNSLIVARVYEEEVLLGIGPNGINLLSRFSPIGEGEIEANNNDDNNSVFDSEYKNAMKNNSVSSEDLTKIPE